MTDDDRAARRIAEDLAERWFSFRVVDGALVIEPACKLTEMDRASINAHREALIALVRATPETAHPKLRFFHFDPGAAFGPPSSQTYPRPSCHTYPPKATDRRRADDRGAHGNEA
jgi:hypothetical protein